MRRSAAAIAATAVLVTGGCTGSEGDGSAGTPSESQTSGSQTTGSQTTDSQPADDVVSERDVDIGGRTLYLRCWGEKVAGEPTVLLLSGSGPPTSYWEPMAAGLASDGHHLCAYDRLGVGRSDAVPEGPRTTDDQVDDLQALLAAADLQEPLILAAHSLGSLPAVGLVDRAPERVVGVVLIDPWSPRVSAAQRAALPPEKPDESPELAEERVFLDNLLDPAQNVEHLDLAENDAVAVRLFDAPGPFFGDIPVVVLNRPPPPYLPGLPRRYHRAYVAAFQAGAEELAAESTHGTLVWVEGTGHDIHVDKPAVVVDAIQDVIGR
jgi:pimeloyl-ACP methyl ester carboxylesterase